MPAHLTILAALLVAQAEPPRVDPPVPPPKADSFKPEAGWKSLGPHVWFDAKQKQLVVRGRVALQDGVLEHFLCKKGTKEHESILSTEAAPRLIHAGLLLTEATPGHPVKFQPKFEPPAGSTVDIKVEWEVDGKKKQADARDWVLDQATGKPLTRSWVFAGSELFEDPRTKAMIYAADDGDLITVANFPAAILDLPFRSSDSDADRSYIADARKVPPIGTPVTMYFKHKPEKAEK